tara:strand:- start:1492 stop:2034 length:543 start_codon:yes stop_codon:yes gene_type:complete
MCFKARSTSQCPICLETKKLTTQCAICTDTRICKDCCLSLCEKGLCGKCPVCRQPNWKKPKKSQIVPIFSKIKINFPSKTEEEEVVYREPSISRQMDCINEYLKCKERVFNIMVFFASCLLIYIVGLFTIFIFAGEDYIKDKLWPFWIAPLVGLGWVALIWSPCCCGKTLRNMYCNREPY